MTSNHTDRSSTILKVLVGLIVFNVVGIGLSEVQRRHLAQASRDQLAESARAIAEMNKRLLLMQAELRSRPQQGAEGFRLGERDAAATLLNAGMTITVRFDDNPSEAVGRDATVSCGSDALSSYLGIFIAGQSYKVSFEPSTQRWRTSGPSQLLEYDRLAKTCALFTATYGPAELREKILPESGTLVLWGSRFQLEGKFVMRNGVKVGEVVGLD